MDALTEQFSVILNNVIEERYVSLLPPLLAPEKFSIQDRNKKQISRGFSAFVLSKLFGLTPQTAANFVVDDYEDNGIDAFYYDKNEETLFLVQSKLRRKEMFSQADANEFCKGIRLFIRQEFHKFNINFQNKLHDAEEAIENCSKIKLIIAYTGNGVAKHARDSLNELLEDPNLDEDRLDQCVQEFNSQEIVKFLLEEQEIQKVDTKIRFIKYQKIESPRNTVFGLVRLKDLVELHKKFDKSLYQKNIRFYLGSSKSGVNSSIKQTLTSEQDKFFYFNNGITAVCDTLELKDSKNSEKNVKVRGFSIVNGAQTVASSAEFCFENPQIDIDDAKVFLTIIQAPSESVFEKKITKSRNHQNPVQMASFAALDDEQERLRKEVALLGVSYHYRPEVDVIGDEKNIHRMDVIRSLACLKLDSRLPALLKLDISRISDPDSNFYKTIFNSSLIGFTLINTVSLYKRFHEKQLEIQNASKGFEKLVYRHAFFVMLYVFMKKFIELVHTCQIIDWSDFEIEISLEIDELRQNCFDLADRNKLEGKGALAFFRNQTTVIPFLVELMSIHFKLTEDAGYIAKNSNTSGKTKNGKEEEFPRQEIVEYLVSKAPKFSLGSKS